MTGRWLFYEALKEGDPERAKMLRHNGYDPSREEWTRVLEEYLSYPEPLRMKETTLQGLEAQAKVKEHYQQLRAERVGKEEAIKRTAVYFDVTEAFVRGVADVKDKRLKPYMEKTRNGKIRVQPHRPLRRLGSDI